MNVAAADVPIAGAPAITAAAVLVVLQSVRCHARAIRSQRAIHALQRVSQMKLGVGQLDGALKLAVRQPGQIFGMPRHAEVFVHAVVIGRDVRVGDGPVFPESVAALSFEIVIGKAQRQAAPNGRFAA